MSWIDDMVELEWIRREGDINFPHDLVLFSISDLTLS
jgi:hypothetical protein